MKKTKRFLALILALIMVISGVLSGIPGLGVVRAEEWDVGTEIIGDGTVADWVGDESAPEQGKADDEATVPEAEKAGTQDIFSEDITEENDVSEESAVGGSSVGVFEEEAEEGSKENLTNAVFGDYTPSSVAETSFDEPEDNKLPDRGIGDVVFKEKNDFAAEEESEIIESIKTAGEGEEPNYIYYTNWNIANSSAWDEEWQGTEGKVYAWCWGGDAGTGSWKELVAIGRYPKDNNNPGIVYRGDIGTATGFNLCKTNDLNNKIVPNDNTILSGALYSAAYGSNKYLEMTTSSEWNSTTGVFYPASSTTIYFTNRDLITNETWGGHWEGEDGKLYARVWGGTVDGGSARWVELKAIGQYKDGGIVFSGDVGDAVRMRIYPERNINTIHKHIQVDKFINNGSLYSPNFDESESVNYLEEAASGNWNPSTDIIYPSSSTTIYFTNRDLRTNTTWGGHWEGQDGKLYAWVWGGTTNGGAGRWVTLNEVGRYKDGGKVFAGDVGDAVGMRIYPTNDLNTTWHHIDLNQLVNDGSLYYPDYNEEIHGTNRFLGEKTSDQWNTANDIIMPSTYTVYFSFDNVVTQGEHFGWKINDTTSFKLAYRLASGRSTSTDADGTNIYGENDVNSGWVYATYVDSGSNSGGSYSVYSMTFTTAENQIMFAIDKDRPLYNSTYCCDAGDHSEYGHRDRTGWIALENGKTYRLKDYPYNNDCYHPVKSDDNYPLAPDLKEVFSSDIASGNELILYYDASLSAIVRDSSKASQTLPYRTFTSGVASSAEPVYLVLEGTNEYYKQTTPLDTDTVHGLGGNRTSGSSYTGTFAGASDGTYLYKFTVDKEKFSADKEFYFTTAHPNTYEEGGNTVTVHNIVSTPGNPSRTAKIKLPKGEYTQIDENDTIPHNCFYGDSSDSYVYGDQPGTPNDNSGRGGYWDNVQGPRDPEKRAMANAAFTYTPSGGGSGSETVSTYYNNVVPTGATNVTSGGVAMVDSVVNINNGTAPKTTAVNTTSMTGTKILKVSLFDFYSDYELNGKNRDTYPLARGWDERGYYGFMSLNNAMSKEYKAKSEEVALYVGNFQRDSYGTGKWSGLAPYGNWLYDFNSNTSNANDQYKKFLSHNNSTVKYSGDVNTDFQAVSWELVDTTTKAADHNGVAGLYTNNGSMLLPQFDTSFLSGSNVLDAKLGKVYDNVIFPFSIERRQKNTTDADKDKYVDYYVFAARNDMMSSSSNYPTIRTNLTQGYGDAALLKRSGDTYFIESTVNTSISGHYNIENTGAEQTAKGSMGFFPFNADLPNTSETNKSSLRYNYGYGMKFETTFKMRRDGMVLARKANGTEYTVSDLPTDVYNSYASSESETEQAKLTNGTALYEQGYLTPMKFRFSGDDDVWVFIDGQLVLDLGGDHTAAEGEIWFNSGKTQGQTGYNKISSSVGKVNGAAGVVKQSPGTDTEKRNETINNVDTNNTIQYFTISDYDTTDHSGEYGVHTLTMYYMERGMWDSNMMVEFNLESYPADSPKVDLVINKVWQPSTAAAAEEARFKVYRREPDKTTKIPVRDSHGNDIFTIPRGQTTLTIPKQEAFVDGDSSKKRFIYEVFELDSNSPTPGEHFVGAVGNGVNSDIATATSRLAATLEVGDTDSFPMVIDSTGATPVTQVYKLTGEAVQTKRPYFVNDENLKNEDGTYTYTATNLATMDITATKTFVGLSNAAITGRTPAPVVALAQALSNSPSDADWRIVGVKNEAYEGSPINYIWEDQLRTNGTTSYYYKVVELAPGTPTTVVDSLLSSVTVLGSTPTKFGDGYYYTTTYSQTGPTAAPATGDMNLGTITNTVQTGQLTINKYKAGSDLENAPREATFTLYSNQDLTSPVMRKSTPSTVVTLTTNASGTGTLDLNDIDYSGKTFPLTYYLAESAAPGSHQAQPGYITIIINADGSYSATASGNFTIDSGTTLSSGSYIPVTTAYTDAAYPLITLNVPNPMLVNISATKTFSPELTNGQTTTVFLKLMRNKRNAGDTAYEADTSFNGAVKRLNIIPGTATSFEATWTGEDRYDSNNKLYQYYVVEVASSTGTEAVSTIPLTLSTGGSAENRTYSVTQSSVVTASANEGNITDLVVANESVDAEINKTWASYTPVAGDTVYVTLQRSTSSTFTGNPDSLGTWGVKLNAAGNGLEDATGTAAPTVTSYTLKKTFTDATHWKIQICGLQAKSDAGNKYYYRLVESNASGTAYTQGQQYGKFTVSYGSISDNTLPAPTESGTTFATDVTNTKETVNAELTKEWPTTTADSIVVKLESATNLAFTENKTTIVQYTIAKPVGDGQPSITSPSAGDLHYSEAVTKGSITNGTKWVLAVTGLDRYDSSGRQLYYRFVEMKPGSGSSWVDASNGDQVGDYLVDYENTLSGAIAVPTAWNTTFSQKITNTLARFELQVEKTFNISGVTGTVYIKLKRRTSSGEDTAFNTTSPHIVALDGTVDSSPSNPNEYESSPLKGTWKELERTNTNGLVYTYYAVEVVPGEITGTYVEKANGDPVQIGNRMFTVTNSGIYTVSDSTPASGSATTLTVSNTLVKPLLDITKVDSANQSTKLAGAKFTLKRTHSVSDGAYVEINGSSNISDNTWESNVTTSTGVASFANGLEDGKYELYESQAPNGYAIHSGKIYFIVTNGIIEVQIGSGAGQTQKEASGLVTDATGNYNPASEILSNVVHFKLTVQNTAGTELPGTGTAFGLSRMGFASLGTVLLTAFVALYMYKKKQRYYDAEDNNIL